MKADKSHGGKIMNDLLLQSEYADIIIGLLNEPFEVSSVVKIVFMSFCIRNESKSSYGNRKTDFVDTLLRNINIKLFSHPEELACIFEVLNKRRKCGWIATMDGKVYALKKLPKIKCENKFLVNCKGKDINPIIEVNKLDDRAFMEEVLRNV